MGLTVRDLYQELGNFFRERGAERIILLSSRPVADPGGRNGKQMILQLAVDGGILEEEVKQDLEERWPQLEIQLMAYGIEATEELLREIEEDGIKL